MLIAAFLLLLFTLRWEQTNLDNLAQFFLNYKLLLCIRSILVAISWHASLLKCCFLVSELHRPQFLDICSVTERENGPRRRDYHHSITVVSTRCRQKWRFIFDWTHRICNIIIVKVFSLNQSKPEMIISLVSILLFQVQKQRRIFNHVVKEVVIF